jgi:hypothetical protein
MPRGITVKLADEQRAMIRKACQDGHGCEDADAPASKLAAINRGRGAVEIHKRTCRDLLRDSHGASVWDIDASTERDCVFDVYPPSEFDYEPADWADFNDLAYMPCTKGLLS